MPADCVASACVASGAAEEMVALVSAPVWGAGVGVATGWAPPSLPPRPVRTTTSRITIASRIAAKMNRRGVARRLRRFTGRRFCGVRPLAGLRGGSRRIPSS